MRGLATDLALRAGHLHGGLRMPLQHRVLRHRHHVVEPGLRIQEIEDLRGRKAPVEPDEKPRPRKRRPQQREQPTQQPEGPVGGHCLPGPQHRRAQILLRLAAVEARKPEQRQITPSRIVPVEERELLGAMRLVVGRVQIDRDPARPPVQAAPMPLDDARCQLAPHPVERGAAHPVLEPRDRGPWRSSVSSSFSRAFAEFSDTQLPQRVHEALIRNTHRDRLVGHLSRDSTAIEAREKPAAKQKAPPPPKRKRGRPKKGEERPKVLKRLDRQAAMTLPAMLNDLPTDCDVGKGYKSTWVGYKLHLDVADGQIPISCLLTSASLHDSQAAIPLATLSAERTTNLYDLMDAAYDAEPIRQHSRSLGHVPLIDTNPRRDKTLAEELRTEARRLQRIGFQLPEQVRYNERTAGERVNGRLKDEFGGRHVRVRGASKVMCHCMFGVLALTADQLVRLVT